jgi:hypothetical protein
MILVKDSAGTVPYLISEGVAPSSFEWSLFDPQGNAHSAAQSVSPPTTYTVSSGTTGNTPDEVVLTCSAPPSELTPGKLARVRDSWGRDHDGIVYGLSGSDLRIADIDPAVASEAASVYCPEVSISIGSSDIDDTGDGWRLALSYVQGGATIAETIWFSVGLFSVGLAVSPREVYDRHPELRSDLAMSENRKDWPRVVASACEMVEERILGEKRWYTMVISSTSLRPAVVAAVWRILAPSTVPENVDSAEWIDRAETGFNSAISAAMASGHYDKDEDEVISKGEESAPLRTSYRVH